MFINKLLSKKLFLSLLFCLVTQLGYCQKVDDSDNLYLYTMSANEAAVYSLDEISKITFSKKGIQIWNTNWPTEYKYSNVRILTFGDKESSLPSKVEYVSEKNTGVNIAYNSSSFILTINSNRVMKGAALYNLNGMMMLSDMMEKRHYRFQLSGMPEGIYIIKVFGDGRPVSKKIVK